MIQDLMQPYIENFIIRERDIYINIYTRRGSSHVCLVGMTFWCLVRSTLTSVCKWIMVDIVTACYCIIPVDHNQWDFQGLDPQ